MKRLVVTSLIVLVACGSADEDGPAEIGERLFAVPAKPAADTSSLLGIWEGGGSDDLVSADDRLELRADGLTIARRCKNAKSTWFAGARTDATVTSTDIDIASKTGAGALSPDDIPCTVYLELLHLQPGQNPRCADGLDVTGRFGCFVLSGGVLSLYAPMDHIAGVGGNLITFAKVAD